jgi:hypothetical protein
LRLGVRARVGGKVRVRVRVKIGLASALGLGLRLVLGLLGLAAGKPLGLLE